MKAYRKHSPPPEARAAPVSNVVSLADRAHDLPDAVLVRAALEGNAWAKEALFKRHLRATRGFAFRLLGSSQDLQDVVQESLTIAFGSLPQLRNPQRFSSWLGRVVINTVHRTLRRRRLLRRLGLPRGPSEDRHFFHLASSAAPPDTALEIDMLYRVLQKLPTKHRMVLVLRRVEGLTVPDIAEQMGASEASIKRWLSKAEAAMQVEIYGDRTGR